MSGKRGLSDVIFSFANASNVTLSKAFCDRLSGHIQQHISTQLIENGKFGLRDLGTLNVVNRRARVSRNPRTGAVVNVPAKKTVSFKCSSTFKSVLNGKQ